MYVYINGRIHLEDVPTGLIDHLLSEILQVDSDLAACAVPRRWFHDHLRVLSRHPGPKSEAPHLKYQHQMVGNTSKDYLTKCKWQNGSAQSFGICVVEVDQRTTNSMVLASQPASQPPDASTDGCKCKTIAERRLHFLMDCLQCVSAISCWPLMHYIHSHSEPPIIQFILDLKFLKGSQLSTTLQFIQTLKTIKELKTWIDPIPDEGLRSSTIEDLGILSSDFRRISTKDHDCITVNQPKQCHLFPRTCFFFVSAWHQRRRALRGIDFTGLESDDRMNFSRLVQFQKKARESDPVQRRMVRFDHPQLLVTIREEQKHPK